MNTARKSESCSTGFPRQKKDGEDSLRDDRALFDGNSGCERRIDYCSNPHHLSAGHSTQGWIPAARRGGDDQEGIGHCKPRSIDDFLSTWISGPLPANVIGTGPAEQCQLGGERDDGGSFGWGITRDPYSASGGLDTRTVSQDDTADRAGFGAPGMASSTRPDGSPPNRFSTHHDGEARFSKRPLPTHPLLASTSTFTPPHPISVPGCLSDTSPCNFQGLTHPLRTYAPALATSSRLFGSGIPPYSAPIGSGFGLYLEPSWPPVPSSGPQTSSATGFPSQAGLGTGGDCRYSRNPDGTEDSSDGAFGLTTGLLSPAFMHSSTSASNSSNLYGMGPSSSSGAYPPWKQEW